MQPYVSRAAVLSRAAVVTRPLSRSLSVLSRSTERSPARVTKMAPSARAFPFAGGSYPLSTAAPRPATKPTCITQSQGPGQPTTYSFFEDATSTWQYLVTDPSTKKAVIIDPVLDYDPASGQISTKTADGILAFVEEHGLGVKMILETHAHADHLTAAQYLKRRLGGDVPVAIGKRIKHVQKYFAPIYSVPKGRLEGAFDKYWEDDEKFTVGELEFQTVHLPGHTPDHVGYRCGRSLFLGDTLFYPDVGSARADFPGGSPVDLYNSIERVLSLEPDVRIYAGHDYPPQGAGQPENRCWSLVSEQRTRNVHLTSQLDKNQSTTPTDHTNDKGVMNAFIQWRAERDRTLGAPRLIHPSLQVNICAGRLPEPDESGRRTLRIPLKVPDQW